MLFSQEISRLIRYKVERLLIKGPLYQVLFIASVIGLISFISGYLLLLIENVPGGILDSSWWAFLRMSDPGYLGDDTGAAKRVLSTILTVLGYVLFMGSFVAIMTQWLYRKMAQLESGLTPITNTGHICILGYTSRTPIILKEIFSASGRLERFLRREKKSNLSVAVLNESVSYQLSNEISTHLQHSPNSRNVILRTGSSMKMEDLSRINVQHSSRVIIPAVGFGSKRYERTDVNAIKALLSIKHLAEEKQVPLPLVVVEILDEKKINIAKDCYGKNIQVIASHQFISRMIAQNTHHPGLSHVYQELLSQEYGNEFYLKQFPNLVGCPWSRVRSSFKNSIPIGIVNSENERSCVLNPDLDTKINSKDFIVFISENFESIKMQSPENLMIESKSGEMVQKVEKRISKKKILIFGWSQKIPILVEELMCTSDPSLIEIDLVTVLSMDERLETTPADLQNVMKTSVNHIVTDYTVADNLKELDFKSYTNILFLANGWLENNIEADARSIMGYLIVREIFKGQPNPPILIELVDPENEGLFIKKSGEIIISPVVVSNMLANVALRPELNEVLDTLFYAEGPEMSFVSPRELSLNGDLSFKDIVEACKFEDLTVIGVMTGNLLVPIINPDLERVFTSIEEDKLIIIK